MSPLGSNPKAENPIKIGDGPPEGSQKPRGGCLRRMVTGLDGAFGGGAEGFQALAGYLFGGNAQSEKMAMTIPVEVRMDGSRGERGSR